MKNKSCSTLGDLKKILSQLIEANDPLNKDLINFYTKKIEVETSKALRKIEAKNIIMKKYTVSQRFATETDTEEMESKSFDSRTNSIILKMRKLFESKLEGLHNNIECVQYR